MSKVSPSSVSTPEAWKLFDRSVSSTFTPDDKPLGIDLDRAEPITAIKVYGPAPYKLEVHSLGFEPIDLSTLERGWHVFATNVITSTKHVELTFHPLGEDGGVPEVELWAQAQHLPAARGTIDLTAAELPADYIRIPATSPADEVSPGNCVEFGLSLPRAPELFRSAHVVYDAKGVFRAFSLTRTVNGLGEQGGTWLAGHNDALTIVDQIDPANLRLGDNTVRLCAPASASQRVTLSNLRLVGELDTGTSLAESVAVGGRDGIALLDGDANTSLDVAAREHVTINFERLVAPDALVLAGTNLAAPDAACVVSSSVTRGVAIHFEKTTDGALVGFGAGALACSALDLTFPSSVSLTALDVIGSGAAERVDWPRVIVTNTAEHFGTKAWVGGFVARPPSMTGAIRIEVADQKATSKTGDFGQLLERQEALPTWPVTITAHLPDGTTQTRQVLLDRDHHAQLDQATSASPTADTTVRPDTRFGRVGDKVEVKAATGAPSKIRLGSAVGLDVPAGALRMPTTISVRQLDNATVPPLDPGMVNVTAPKDRGYEFLPHGQRFAKPIEVLVPFDPSLIPSEMSANDVHTFYYDTADKKWKQLARTGLDVGEHVAHSATDHFTIMIDAVLATPKNPTPLSFDPTAMSSISGALPTDNMDLIAPPEANSSGDANVSLPIRVPAGRGAFTPSLSIAYSSAASDGWLGLGWELAISRIEIDTRWGVPTFDHEQRYVLDGAELIPTSETEGPLCQNGTRGHRYRPRIEGGFAHIAACETGGAMHFEVHDRNGTLFVYGAPLSDPADTTHIARWQLSKVVDVHGNTTVFQYTVDNVPTVEPGREIYPSSIAYTSGGATTAAYTIAFQLDDGTRPDVITSGRSGFKTTVQHLLRAIHVSYRGQIIRDYVLTYQHGQFQKTTLANVRVYGAGGCATSANAFTAPSCSASNFFNQHTFDYFQEAEAFGASTHLFMGGKDAAQRMPLTTGATSTVHGGLSESIAITPALSISFGASVQTSSRREELGLYDVNGDGLPDQVFVDGDGITALYNQSVPGVDPATHLLFAPDPTKAVVGLPSLGSESSSGWGESVGAHLVVSLDGSYSNSGSSAGRRMVDIDGDGFVDSLATRSSFGRPCPQGTCFSEQPYGAVNGINPFEDPALQGLANDVGQRLMLANPVVHWTAPKKGHVRVTGLARKLAPGGTNLSVELYHGDSEIGAALTINAFDVLTHSLPTDDFDVDVGDTVSLRVRNGGDDTTSSAGVPLDLVDADLHVDYQTSCDGGCGSATDPLRRDSTGSWLYSFDSKDDFRVAGTPTFVISPVEGTLELHAVLNKTVSAADVRACVQKFHAPNAAQELDLDVPCSDASHRLSGPYDMPSFVSGPQQIDVWSSYATSPPSPDLNVEAGDIIMLRVESDFSFDPNNVSIDPLPGQPYFTFTQVCIPDETTSTALCSTSTGDIGSISLPSRALNDFGPYIALTPPATEGLVVPTATTVSFAPIDPLDLGNSYIRITTDRQGVVFTKDCVLGCTLPVSLPPLTVGAGEAVYIEFSSEAAISLGHVTATYTAGSPFSAPITKHLFGDTVTAGHTPFAGGFHGWRSGMWNDAEPYAPDALIQGYENFAALIDSEKARVARTAIAPVASFGHNIAIGELPAWAGPGSIAFVSATGLNPGHLNLIGDGSSGGGNGGMFTGGYSRVSSTKSMTLDGSASLTDSGSAIFGVTLGVSTGSSDTTTSADALDLDGDGILDVLANSQLTVGTLTSDPSGRRQIANWGPSALRKHHGFDYSIKLGGKAMKPVVSSSGRTLFMDQETHEPLGLGFNSGFGYGIGRSETTNEMVDVNGDGLPDQLERDGADLKVRLNLGSRFGALEPFGAVAPSLLPAALPIDRFQGAESLSGWAALVPSIPGFSPDTTRNALDHDTTLTQQKTESTDFFFYSSTKTTTLTTTRTTRTVADINGDGLPDLIVKVERLPDGSLAPFIVQYNLGSSFGPRVSWGTPPWDVALAPTFETELLNFGTVGPDVISATGTGDQSVSNGSSLSIPIPFTPFTVGGDYSTSVTRDTFELALMDIDGDGAPDHVLRRTTALSGGTPTAYIKFNQVTGRSNLLRSVSRPLGGSFALDYARKGNTVDMPHSRQVLSRVEVNDGVDLGPNFPSPNLVTTFAYDQGVYSRNEKEFFGFGKVTTTRADGVTVEDVYENDPHQFALHAKLIREVKRDGASNLLHEHDISYSVLDVLDASNQIVTGDSGCTSELPGLLARESSPCTPTFPVVTLDSETRSEGGVTKTRTTSDLASDHDRFGNVLASTDTGDDAIANDDVYAGATYQNDTATWVLGRPTSLVVRAGSTGGTILRSRTGEFNGTGDLIALHVDTGNGIATSTFGYDSYGNLNHVTTPPNEGSQTQTYDVTYDADVEMYPVTTVDGFGYTSHATYDARFGVAVSETDINNQQLLRTVDAFGRVVQTRSPYDSTSTGVFNVYNTSAVPAGVVTGALPSVPPGTTAPLPTGTITATYVDGLGRPIEQRKSFVVDTTSGVVTSGVVGRDSVGRVFKTQNPFFTAVTSLAFVTPVSTLATTVAFDVMDRPISTAYPDGNTESASYDIDKDPDLRWLFHTHTIDANGHARDTYQDVNGHTRAYIEHPTTTTSSTTKYDYLTTGELSHIKDADGNESALAYDLRGLRTSLSNPDTGLIESRYDLMGNRIALIEPNQRALGTEIHYSFDRNRLGQVDYPQKPDVKYMYGGVAAPNNAAGRITSISDETGTQSFEYGSLGETRRTLRAVTDTTAVPATNVTFDTHLIYDSFGRLLQTTYPDGEIVTNTYNGGGVLSAVAGAGNGWSRTYASDLRYDVFGNRTHAQFGNNDVSDWTFDPARVRLSSLVTTLAGTTTKIQDLHYTYDAVGNPTTILNSLPASPTSNALPGTAQHSFVYDGVDRLTSATGVGTVPNGSSTYGLSFSYSPSHRITHKTSTHQIVVSAVSTFPSDTNYSSTYKYAGAQPHLPSSVGSLDIQYDASGNPVTRETSAGVEELTWDDDNRLIQVSGTVKQYNLYDVSGLRVVRNGSAHTIFASTLFEFDTGTTGTKHVFAGPTRITSVVSSFASGVNPAPPVPQGTPYYLHENHLGSTAVVTVNNKVNDAHEYFPDGAAWIDSGVSHSIDGHLFSGKPFDADTGFYDYGQRFYDPHLSLWLGNDTAFTEGPAVAVGAPVMLSTAAYGANNPSRLTDPDGRCPGYGMGAAQIIPCEDLGVEPKSGAEVVKEQAWGLFDLIDVGVGNKISNPKPQSLKQSAIELGLLVLTAVLLDDPIDTSEGGFRGVGSGPRPVRPPADGQIVPGIPDNPAGAHVLEGHGATAPGSFTLPQGTWLRVPNESITNAEGEAAAQAGTFPSSVRSSLYPPGSQVPNFVLLPATRDQFIRMSSTVVMRATYLSDILVENMGICVWAACR